MAMMMCSICKENLAVVFITKIVNGKQTQEGLCFSCAKKQGIQPINQILEQTGISDEEIDDLNKQVGSFFEDMDFSSMNDTEAGPNSANPFLNLINKSLNRTMDSMGIKGTKEETESDSKAERKIRTKAIQGLRLRIKRLQKRKSTLTLTGQI